jgi:hypothetical protein
MKSSAEHWELCLPPWKPPIPLTLALTFTISDCLCSQRVLKSSRQRQAEGSDDFTEKILTLEIED